MLAQFLQSTRYMMTRVHQWMAPDIMKFKANSDVAFEKGDSDNTIAVVVTRVGTPVDGLTKPPKDFLCFALQGGTGSYWRSFLMVSSLGMQGVSVESDNKQAILLSVSI